MQSLKILNRTLPLLALLILIFTSCGKHGTAGLKEPYLDGRDVALAMNILADVRDDVLLKTQNPKLGLSGYPLTGLGDCPSINSFSSAGTYPNKLILDYGKDCSCRYNLLKSGKVIINQSASLDKSNAKWEIQFLDFTINGVKIEGTQTLSPMGGAESPNNGYAITTENLSLKWPNGKTTVLNSKGNYIQAKGQETPNPEDDMYEFTGEASGITATGVSFKGKILNPLVKQRKCLWISGGSMEIGTGNENLTADFGIADCDEQVKIQLPGGEFRDMDMIPGTRR